MSRLHTILTKVRQLKGKGNREILSILFETDPKDNINITKGYVSFLNLIDTAEEEISNSININHELYLKPIKIIKQNFLSLNIDAFSTRIEQLNTEVMSNLQYVNDAITRQVGEPLIDQDELQQLLQDVNELLEQIMSSKLPAELKNIIIRNLENIRHAIIEYRINGIESLKQILESSFGYVASNKDIIMKYREEPVVQKYSTVLTNLTQLVSLVHTSALIGTMFAQLLAG